MDQGLEGALPQSVPPPGWSAGHGDEALTAAHQPDGATTSRVSDMARAVRRRPRIAAAIALMVVAALVIVATQAGGGPSVADKAYQRYLSTLSPSQRILASATPAQQDFLNACDSYLIFSGNTDVNANDPRCACALQHVHISPEQWKADDQAYFKPGMTSGDGPTLPPMYEQAISSC